MLLPSRGQYRKATQATRVYPPAPPPFDYADSTCRGATVQLLANCCSYRSSAIVPQEAIDIPGYNKFLRPSSGSIIYCRTRLSLEWRDPIINRSSLHARSIALHATNVARFTTLARTFASISCAVSSRNTQPRSCIDYVKYTPTFYSRDFFFFFFLERSNNGRPPPPATPTLIYGNYEKLRA